MLTCPLCKNKRHPSNINIEFGICKYCLDKKLKAFKKKETKHGQFLEHWEMRRNDPNFMNQSLEQFKRGKTYTLK